MPKNKEKLVENINNFDKYNDLIADQWQTVYLGRWNNEFDWYISYLYYLGFQNSKFNYTTREISLGTRSDRMANKVFSSVRSVANYVTRNRPRWEVVPFNLLEDGFKYSKDNARLNKLLDYYTIQNQTKRKIRSAVKDALMTSCGIIQTVWRSNAMDGNGDIDFNVIDPFDFYVDPIASSISNARFCIYSTAVTFEGLKRTGIYDQKALETAQSAITQLQSENANKSSIMFFKNGMSGGTKSTGNILLREHWFYDDDKKVICVTSLEGQIIKVQKFSDMKSLPFSVFQTDENSRSIYGVSWVQNLIPLQNEFNECLTSLSEYNRLANKATYIVREGEKVRMTDNNHCRIVTASDPSQFQRFDTPPLSPAIYQEIELLEKLFEDISGQSEASRGRVPTGVTSGRGLEILQIGDANNLSNLIESFEGFMEDIGGKILELCSYHYTECRNVLTEDYASRKEFMRVIGMGLATEEMKQKGVLEIPEKNLVKVHIGSYLTESPSSKIERIERLAQMGAVDTQTLLVANQMTDIDDILSRKQEEKAEQANMEIQQQAAQNQVGQPQEAQGQSAGTMAAIGAIQAIVNNQQPEIPQNPDQNFLDYLVNFTRSDMMDELDENQKQMVSGLMAQVQQTIGG